MGNVRSLAVGLALGILASGCGGDNAPGIPTDEQDATPGDDDAGDAGDGGEVAHDGGDLPADAGTDAAPLPDAADGGGNVSECVGDLLEFPAARSVGRPLSAALVGNRTHLVYVVPSGGGTSGNNTAQGLRYVSFDTASAAPAPVDLVNVGMDSYNRTRDPSLLARGQGLDLIYTATFAGMPFELFSKNVGTAAAAVQETSSNTRVETANRLGAFGDDLALLYSADSPTANMPGALMLKLQGKSAQELVPESAGYHASEIAFAAFGEGAELRGMTVFLSDLATKPGIFAQTVGANGGPSGALTTLSTQIGGTSSVDVTKGRDGGGLIYTEAPAGGVHQLRFRELDSTGTLTGAVKNLTSGNQNLRDISIAPYSHGYVIAYRRVGGLPSAQATIYLLFIDAQGNISGTRLVRSAELTGGGLKVLVANDGRLIVLWADTETSVNPVTNKTEIGLRVRAARLTCAM
jgi:hypothetical protein